MHLAVSKAQEIGAGAAAVTRSSHFGAAAYYTLIAARQDCIGFTFTNADSLVKAFGSKVAYFGTNPVCMAAPMADEGPFCLDMATSSISWNKVKNYRMSNFMLEPGLAFDAAGRGVINPHEAASLAPTGGYKGFGLGMMVEILCGLLAGGPVAREIIPMYQDLDRQRSISHFLLALDIKSFTDPAAFRRRLRSMADSVRSLARVDDAVPVVIPGDPEKYAMLTRAKQGIPIDKIKYQEFLALNKRFSEALRR
jgi:LDH2 family malate/lactate/ureidoglycolate dehydrogenase